VKKSAWSSPLVVFALVFSAVLSCGLLVVRELKAGARNIEAGRAAPASATRVLSFVHDWRALTDSNAARDSAYGNASAPVQMIVFADYQCAGCAALHALLDVARDSVPGLFALSVRHYPLSIHAHARAAANAAECARDHKRFAAYEAVLYGSQSTIGLKSYTHFAERAGIADTARFSACVRDGVHLTRVDADRARADQLHLPGTPVYIVNGQPHFGAPPLATLLGQLRHAADEARAASKAPVAPVAPQLAPPQLAPSVETSFASPPLQHINAGRKREWLEAPLLLRRITGTPNDELLMPGSLTTSASGDIVVFDFGAMELRAFRPDGRQLWRSGRKGGGPGEFRNAMDLKRTHDGNLAVLDMGNRRITVLSAAGKLRRMIPVKMSSSRFIPIGDSTVFGLTSTDSGSLWASVDATGNRVARSRAPADIATRDGLEREAFTATVGDSSVMSFRWSDQLIVLNRHGQVVRRVQGIEPVAFPGISSYPMKAGKFSGKVSRINPHAPEASRSITSDGRFIYVLFSGTAATRNRTIDVYDATSVRYEGSFELPAEAIELTSLPDGLLAVMRLDPVPAIDIWRLPPRFRSEPNASQSVEPETTTASARRQ
jgi:protein-disulfide isomerase